MVERARRLRVGLAHSSSGASGDTGPAQLRGSVRQRTDEADESGRKPAESRAFRLSAAPVRLQKAVSRGKENASVERLYVNALRHWACAARRLNVTRAFRRSAPLTFVREHSPRERGDGKSRRSPRLAKTGAAELWVLARAGCGTWIGHPVRTRGRQRRTPMRVKN